MCKVIALSLLIKIICLNFPFLSDYKNVFSDVSCETTTHTYKFEEIVFIHFNFFKTGCNISEENIPKTMYNVFYIYIYIYLFLNSSNIYMLFHKTSLDTFLYSVNKRKFKHLILINSEVQLLELLINC